LRRGPSISSSKLEYCGRGSSSGKARRRFNPCQDWPFSLQWSFAMDFSDDLVGSFFTSRSSEYPFSSNSCWIGCSSGKRVRISYSSNFLRCSGVSLTISSMSMRWATLLSASVSSNSKDDSSSRDIAGYGRSCQLGCPSASLDCCNAWEYRSIGLLYF
jgi:hypothetical protein